MPANKTYRIVLILLLLAVAFSCKQPKPFGEKFEWLPSSTAPELYPVSLASGYFTFADGQTLRMMSTSDPLKYGWGENRAVTVIGDRYKPVPVKLDITWLSYTEDKFYSGEFKLPVDSVTRLFKTGYTDAITRKHKTFDNIMVGMAPGGVVVVWLEGINNQVEIGRYQASLSKITMQEYISIKGYSPDMSKDRVALCKSMMDDEPEARANLKLKGLQFGLWDTYRERFSMKPVVAFENAVHPEVSDIYMRFYNGEQEDLVLETLQKNTFTPRARIKKLLVRWHEITGNKTQKYMLQYEMDEAEVFNAYKEVYANNAKQPVELLIQLNANHNKFHILLQHGNKKAELINGKGEMYLDD